MEGSKEQEQNKVEDQLSSEQSPATLSEKSTEESKDKKNSKAERDKKKQDRLIAR